MQSASKNKKYLLFLDNIQDSKDECFKIEDFETAYLHFDAYNERYKINKCEVCGKWFKIESIKHPYQKYCKTCQKNRELDTKKRYWHSKK